MDQNQDHAGGNTSPVQGIPHRYRIIRQLGVGGMGAVYLALDTNLDKKVALKVLNTMLLEENPELIQRFQREAKAAAKLSNESLVTVLDFGLTPLGQPYLVMDYVSGPTLQERIKELGKLSYSEALEIVSALAAALGYAHSKGVVHRDLKSSNIVLARRDDGEEYPVIIDFGISVLLDNSADQPALTRTNAIVGSPLYMSPEQIRGQRADERSDIYSLGCVFYECLSGDPPFRGATALDTMNMHLERELPPLEMESEDLEEILRKALSKEPSDRFQSMQEFHAALDILISSESENSDEIPVFQSMANSMRQASIGWPILALLITVGIFAIALFLGRFKPDTDTRLRTSKDTVEAISAKDVDKLADLDQSGILTTRKITSQELSRMLDVQEKQGKDRINLSGYEIDQALLGILAKNRFIRNADFKRAVFTDQSALSLLKEMNLSTVTLRESNIDDTGFESISQLRKLTELDIEACENLTEKSYSTVSKLSNLKNLQIGGDNVKDTVFAYVAKIRDLNSLTVNLSKDVTADGLKIIANMPLQRLRLRGKKNNKNNKKIGPACLETISTLSSLRNLYLVDIPLGDSKDELYDCLRKLDKLEELELKHTGITDKDMKEYQKEHPQCKMELIQDSELLESPR